MIFIKKLLWLGLGLKIRDQDNTKYVAPQHLYFLKNGKKFISRHRDLSQPIRIYRP